MCMGGGGGGGMGGGGMGGGGGFAGSSFGIGNMSSGLSFGGSGSEIVSAPLTGVTNDNDNVTEANKKFLGSKPGFSEKKMQALANRSGKSSLYIS